MQINRRPLYNSLRMNWVMDPTLDVEPWQVEDYRAMPLDVLFERLEDKGICLDKSSFKIYAESVDTPEDLTDALLADFDEADTKTQDQVYLTIFELWRRLLPEKNCLSIFCDELDHQIHLFDGGQVESIESIQDALANLQAILDENVDNGSDPVEAFECIESGCANDIEIFLHDFIAELIDEGNYSYANELLDGFLNYLHDVKWFEFLRARLLAANNNVAEATLMIRELIEDKSSPPDLELNLEILSFMVRNGDRETFERLVRQTTDLLQIEEDFQALLSICADFFHRLDCEQVEEALLSLLKQRQKHDGEKKFDRREPQLKEFIKIISR